MAAATLKQARAADDELSSDDEVALVTAAAKPSLSTPAVARKPAPGDDDGAELTLGAEMDGGGGESVSAEAKDPGATVLALLDKIIGAVDQIQQNQDGLEARQETVEKSLTKVQVELLRLTKSHTGTAATAAKLLTKVRKVNVNVKGVRAELDRQAAHIKNLENNEHELLKRKNFKMLIFQEKPVLHITPPAPTEEEEEQVVSEGGEADLGSDAEVEVEETVEESRAARLKRSGLQRVDELKKAFSKEQMEKTRQKTKENLEKTRQRTKENLERTRLRTRENLQKTRQNLGKKMGKLSTKITSSTERKEKLRLSRDKMKKTVRPKTTTYRVPPFTFYVKKIREGEVEPELNPEAGPAEEEEEEEEEEEWEEEVEEQEGELVDLSSPEGRVALERPEQRQAAVQASVRPRGNSRL